MNTDSAEGVDMFGHERISELYTDRLPWLVRADEI